MIKYYKIIEDGDFSIWALRDDSMEKCLYSQYTDERISQWHYPPNIGFGFPTIPEMVEDPKETVIEISKQEAFILAL